MPLHEDYVTRMIRLAAEAIGRALKKARGERYEEAYDELGVAFGEGLRLPVLQWQRLDLELLEQLQGEDQFLFLAELLDARADIDAMRGLHEMSGHWREFARQARERVAGE